MYRTAYTISILLLLFTPLLSKAQAVKWEKGKAAVELQPVIALQLWSSYTLGQEVYRPEKSSYEAVENRLNFQMRRSRFGVKGKAFDRVKFNIVAAFDLVGRDVLAGTEAGMNNGSSPQLRLWNAYLRWKALKKADFLHISAGYLLPQIGRESTTSAMRSTSMEKSWSQNYLRRHLVGKGPGRTEGISLGGLFYQDQNLLNWGYDIGLYNPAFREYDGQSVGDEYAPLYSGRLALYIGEPESRQYKSSRQVNYFGERRGLTVAAAGAYQGRTSLFSSNSAAGIDWLLNMGHWNIDGEWYYLWRAKEGRQEQNAQPLSAGARTGYLRMSYNIGLPHGWVLEPVGMLMQFNGATDAAGQAEAASLEAFAGEEQILNVGFNFYFNPDLKLSLQYTHREGDAGAVGDGATVNNYFYQPGVGAIRRGDWLGLGLVAIL